MRYVKIEINDETATALRDLSQLDVEEGSPMLNRSTIICRAVQVWQMIRAHQNAGGEVFFRDKGSTSLDRVTFKTRKR